MSMLKKTRKTQSNTLRCDNDDDPVIAAAIESHHLRPQEAKSINSYRYSRALLGSLLLAGSSAAEGHDARWQRRCRLRMRVPRS
jgi:hypothetical protein